MENSWPVASAAMNAAVARSTGGIDLNRNKMNMNVQKDAAMGGVDVKFDPAMVENIRRNGFDGLNFRVRSFQQINLPQLLGLQLRKEDEEKLVSL